MQNDKYFMLHGEADLNTYNLIPSYPDLEYLYRNDDKYVESVDIERIVFEREVVENQDQLVKGTATDIDNLCYRMYPLLPDQPVLRMNFEQYALIRDSELGSLFPADQWEKQKKRIIKEFDAYANVYRNNIDKLPVYLSYGVDIGIVRIPYLQTEKFIPVIGRREIPNSNHKVQYYERVHPLYPVGMSLEDIYRIEKEALSRMKFIGNREQKFLEEYNVRMAVLKN